MEDNTYSLTGEAFSSVALPETAVTTTKTLQEDDVTLGAPQNAILGFAYRLTNPSLCLRSLRVCTGCALKPRLPLTSTHFTRFCTQARKFPGYTSDNLSESEFGFQTPVPATRNL